MWWLEKDWVLNIYCDDTVIGVNLEVGRIIDSIVGVAVD